MFSNLTEKIKSRSSSEWNDLIRSRVVELRDFVRTNGEVAAVIGFCVGISFILMFKLWLLLIGLGIVVYALVLLIADS